MVLHPLLLGLVAIGGDRLSQLLLLPLEVGVRQLVDRLVEKGPGSHRRLTHRQLQDLIGAEPLEALHQCVAGKALGQHLGRVVAGRLLPVAPRQTEDERAARVIHLLAVVVAADLLVVVPAELPLGDEVAPRLGVVHVPLGLDLDQVLLGEEAGVAEQCLVDGAELIDAELRVRDPAAAALAAALGQREQLEDLLQDLVAQLCGREETRLGLVEEPASQGQELEPITGLVRISGRLVPQRQLLGAALVVAAVQDAE